MLLTALVVIGIILILVSVLSLSDNLIQIEAQKQGIDTEKNNLSVLPSFRDLFSSSVPGYVDKSKFHRLNRGMDIKLAGSASKEIANAMFPDMQLCLNFLEEYLRFQKWKSLLGMKYKQGR